MKENVFYTSIERAGDNILFRGYHGNKRVKERVPFKPSLFIPTKKPTKYKALDGTPVDVVEFGTMKEATSFSKGYADVNNFKTYGQTNMVLQFINQHFSEEIKFDSDIINVTAIDIEVKSDQGFPEPREALHPITAICIHNNIDTNYYCWGLGDYNPQLTELKDAYIEYVKCDTEVELLTKFLSHWTSNYPDVVTGWNSKLFDMTYIVNRLKTQMGDHYAKKLSPWNQLNERMITSHGREQQAYSVRGIQQLDYLDLFKKFAYAYGTQSSYRLDAIAELVLGTKKLDYSEHASLHDLYINDHQKFIDYNVKDVQIIDQLEDKMGLVTLAMTVAYRAGVNLEDVFGPVGLWDSLIYNYLKRDNIVIPPKVNATNEYGIEGGYVKDPVKGMHKWICSFDLNSLYPHIIMQYNMSPETTMAAQNNDVHVDGLLNGEEYDWDKDNCITARGNQFTKKKKGFLPNIIDKFYTERVGIKEEMLKVEQEKQNTDKVDMHKHHQLDKDISRLHNRQMAIKILLNSLYGAFSNPYFRYFDLRIAESITMTGQLTIRWAEKVINGYLNKILNTNNDYVIAIDTDSLYVNLDPLVEKAVDSDDIQKITKFIDNVATQKLEPLLKDGYADLAKKLNAYEQKMFMSREAIANVGIWTGKKRYALNVINNEGVQYKEPKMKIMGIESVRSSTPIACRPLIEESLKIILNTQSESVIQAYIAEQKEKFKKLPVSEISFPRGVNGLNKYKGSSNVYEKGTPIHVRAAILYNKLIKDNKLSKKYETINNGEKIKFVYLKVPNTLGENVIGFLDDLPKEFDLHKYIDYDKQFEKSYLEPMKTIMESMNWEAEKQNNLEDFFI